MHVVPISFPRDPPGNHNEPHPGATQRLQAVNLAEPLYQGVHGRLHVRIRRRDGDRGGQGRAGLGRQGVWRRAGCLPPRQNAHHRSHRLGRR